LIVVARDAPWRAATNAPEPMRQTAAIAAITRFFA
jgi:hypothetical protein